MAPSSRRQAQWLSRTLQVILPSDPKLVRLTLEAPRQVFRHYMSPGAPGATAWMVAAALYLATRPSARPRRRGDLVSLRLDRLGAQIQVGAKVVPSPAVNPLFLQIRNQTALALGMSPSPRAQCRALRWFATHLLTFGFPPFRILVNHADLTRLRVGLEAHPLQFVLQVWLWGTGPLLRLAPPQPRGRQRRTAESAPLIGFLACVADELLGQRGSDLEKIKAMARQAGWLTEARLGLIHFLVERALPQLGVQTLDLAQTDHLQFARTYLYPYRGRLGDLPRRAATIPAIRRILMGPGGRSLAKIRT